MWNEVIKLALSNGLWAVLFCALLIYQLKDSKRRELKYVGTIDELIDRLKLVNSVKEDTGKIVESVKHFADKPIKAKKDDKQHIEIINKNDKAAIKV